MSDPVKSTDCTRLPGSDLPIFREDGADYTLFYAPGCVVVAAPDAAGELADAITDHSLSLPWAERLRQHAERVIQVSERQRTEPFRPECLTLYLHNQCNLGCVYCYADPVSRPGAFLEPETIAAAADLVAENCRAKGLPLTVVFHGGGEPALFQEDVARALALVERAAQSYGLDQFRYIATNGVMSEAKMRWLAERFDLIGLSCDGPPDIQNQQRPRANGGATSEVVERNAEVLHQIGRPFHVRATITAATLPRQAEIAEYLCARLAPQEIHVEPVYTGGRSTLRLESDQAETFVQHFLAARDVARSFGIPLTMSGSRPGVVHGPYCNVFRHVLNLVPPGIATACFKTVDESQARACGVIIGGFDLATGRFDVDDSRIRAQRQQLSVTPPACAACFNRHHCAGACPDRCPLEGKNDSPLSTFRCRVQKQVAYVILREKAETLWTGQGIHGTTDF